MGALGRVIGSLRKTARAHMLPSYARLQALMARYTAAHLAGVEPAAFKRRIDGFLALDDSAMEGFANAERQRDLSVKFHWGHDHDFGDFALEGRMADRHIQLLAIFRDRFKALPESLDGLRVLDIGCWTGGTSLLLCAMGAEVVAIEEVKKYAECAAYLGEAFGVRKLTVKNVSLYECTTPEFQDAFDIVLFAGVLYHVSDPVLALRIVFNALKDGGACMVETMASRSGRCVCDYWGPGAFTGGSRRGGWSWFLPSASALKRMLEDAGFGQVQVQRRSDRAFAVGRRERHVDIMRGGLSVRDIR